MIKITIYQNVKKEYVGFQTEGHAGYAESGEDIVCASVSVLVINTINSIERLTEDSASVQSEEDSGLIKYRFEKTPSREATLLFSAMVLGLKDMVEDEEYSKYIDLRFREV